MKSPKGFDDENVDALFFRNSSQYLLLTLAFILAYLILKPFQMILKKYKDNLVYRMVDFII